MIFKNILFGIGGSAIVGGVGYGIYSSSQTNENEKLKTDEKEQRKEVGEENKNGEETQQPPQLGTNVISKGDNTQEKENTETENNQLSGVIGERQTDSGVKTNTETSGGKTT